MPLQGQAKLDYMKRYNTENRETIARKRYVRYRENKPWHQAYHSKHYIDNQEAKKAYARAYNEANKEKIKLQRKERYDSNKLFFRDRNLRKYYGLTLEDYEKLLNSQGRRCAICHTDNPRGRGVFHVDHNHSTGQNRGLLCHKCNSFLGLANESEEILLEAIAYLRSYNGNA